MRFMANSNLLTIGLAIAIMATSTAVMAQPVPLPPATGAPGFGSENWGNMYGFSTIPFRFFLSTPFDGRFTDATTRGTFISEATYAISTYLGLSGSRINVFSFARSTQILANGMQDTRALLQVYIDYPNGWDSLPANPSLLGKQPAWQAGFAGSTLWFPAKWGLKTVACGAQGLTVASSNGQLCDFVDNNLASVASPSPSALPPAGSVSSPPPVVSSPSPSPPPLSSPSPSPPPLPPSPPSPSPPPPPPSPFPQPPTPPTPPGFVAFPPPNPPPPSPPPPTYPPPAAGRRLLR